MKKDNGIFVAIIQGEERYFEANPSAREFESNSVKNMVKDIVYESGITTHRKNPVCIPVTVESIGTKDGKITRSAFRTIEVQPPVAPMTAAEFMTEWDELLGNLPPEFQSAVSILVHENADDSKETLLCGLKDFIERLTPAIEAHAKRCADQACLAVLTKNLHPTH